VRLCLAYLYGDLMSLYGDRGNILALQRRCAWRDISVDLVELTVGDRVDAVGTDLFFFGGGQDREQEAVSRDLQDGNGEALRTAVEDGAALLAVCGGYQLLGHFFRTSEGHEIPGTGLFDVYTVAGPTRNVGNVVAEASLDGERHTLVGFENHSGRTYPAGPLSPSPLPQLQTRNPGLSSAEGSKPETVPLAHVLVGKGNNGSDGFEGARYRGAVGTYLHGPVLPKNPWLADWLILTALRRHLGAEAALAPMDEEIENAARSAVIERIRRKGNVRASIR
jgi:CobQ-like glutamine amidotransferase family enzyme